MTETHIRTVSVDAVDANHWRNTATYPPIPRKVEALKSSIQTVGMWESIIVRPHPSKKGHYEQAFGHQRMFAARELRMKTVPVIVRDLTDQQMLQFMGRENGEDYSADFLIMLNTWEAGREFVRARGQIPKDVEIARLLGWTRPGTRGSGYDVMNDVASAASGALALIEGGHMARDDLEDLSVRVARDIVSRAISRIATIEHDAKLRGAKPKDVTAAKRIVGRGAKETARQARKGQIPHRDIASAVDANTLEIAGKEAKGGKLPPLFVPYAKLVIDQLAKMLNGDSAVEKLRMVAEALDFIVEPEHRALVRQMGRELEELGNRTRDWRGRLDPDRVRPFPAPLQVGGPKE